MNVGKILSMIDGIAPFDSQEEWDNSGLLVGSPSADVTGILFALDLSEPVIDEAIEKGASLIVTHHPVMFSARRQITDADYEGRLISRMIRSGISLIAAHTNLDRAPGGINDTLAAASGLSGVTGEGFFRAGNLPQPLSVSGYAAQLSLDLACTVRIMGPENVPVQKVGLSSGGGGDAWAEAVGNGCEAFITGEMKHHLALAAADAGLVVLECGHFATEFPGIRALAETLQNQLNQLECNLGIFVSKVPAYAFLQQP